MKPIVKIKDPPLIIPAENITKILESKYKNKDILIVLYSAYCSIAIWSDYKMEKFGFNKNQIKKGTKALEKLGLILKGIPQ